MPFLDELDNNYYTTYGKQAVWQSHFENESHASLCVCILVIRLKNQFNSNDNKPTESYKEIAFNWSTKSKKYSLPNTNTQIGQWIQRKFQYRRYIMKYSTTYAGGDNALLFDTDETALCRFFNCDGFTPGALLTDEFSFVGPPVAGWPLFDRRDAALWGREDELSFLSKRDNEDTDNVASYYQWLI